MSDIASAAAPSAPAQTSTPSATSSTPSTSNGQSSVPSSPVRQTTADLAQKLYGHNNAEQESDVEVSAEEPVSTGAETETPWYERELHGLKLQELAEALENGTIPEALWDKIRMTHKDGDNEWEESLSDMRNGRMMQAAFTRKTQDLAAEKKAFYSERDEMIQYMQGWKADPEQLVYGLERMGMPLLEAAQILAKRLTYADTLNANVPGSGDEWLEAQKMKAEYADLKRSQERALEQEKSSKAAEKQAKVRENLQNESKKVFDSIGLRLEESSWSLYTQHVQAIVDSKPEGAPRLTKADLERAARATKSQIDQYVQAYAKGPGQQKPAGAPKLSGPGLDAGAPKKVPERAPKQNKPKTTAEFYEAIRARQGIKVR